MQGPSPVGASGGHSSSRCAGLSPLRPPLFQGTGSRCTGSVVVAHGPSRSAAYGILPDQGSNLCPLHRQADSQPLRHQGSPSVHFNSNFDNVESVVASEFTPSSVFQHCIMNTWCLGRYFCRKWKHCRANSSIIWTLINKIFKPHLLSCLFWYNKFIICKWWDHALEFLMTE